MNHRQNRPGEFAMRPKRNHQTPDPDHSSDRLDQLWAVTRSAELSAATMDFLWAGAARELDRIEEARREGRATPDRLTLADRSRRRRVFVGIALAQAAVVLIGVGYALTRPTVSTDLGKPVLVDQALTTPTPTSLAVRPVIEVATGQTLHVRIGDDGPHYDFLTEPSVTSTLPEGMSHDFFNAMESMASL